MFRADAKKARPLLRDKDGSIFFDHNPIYFSYLLDQLRAIKRMPKRLAYQHQFSAPFMISPSLNFTHMLVDLGLTGEEISYSAVVFHSLALSMFIVASDLLSPMEGTHRNLTVKSLIGWQECYRSTYDVPFNASILTTSCNGSRLLVGCRPVEKRNILTLAGIGQREDVFHPCLPKPCRRMNRKFKKTNRTRSSSSSCSASYQCITQAKRGVGWYDVGGQAWGFVRGSLSFSINPCDASDLDADYRLCWTMKSDEKQVSSDRCGSAKNLQASKRWERVIYHIDWVVLDRLAILFYAICCCVLCVPRISPSPSLVCWKEVPWVLPTRT